MCLVLGNRRLLRGVAVIGINDAAGAPFFTAQNMHRRVQTSPNIIKVAVTAVPTLADIRTSRFFANGVKLQIPHEFFEFSVVTAAWNSRLNPRRMTTLFYFSVR